MDASLYEQHAALEGSQWWFVARRAIIASVLDRFVGSTPGNRRILDTGCGTGGMLPLLTTYGAVTGIEGAAGAVAVCHERYPEIEVRHGSVLDEIGSDDPFDVVTAFDVIEHIEDDAAAVQALKGALPAGGTIVVTVPAYQWLWSTHDELNGHHRRYRRAGLIQLLEDADLEVVHASYFNAILLPVVAAARLAQRVRQRPAAPEPDSDLWMPVPKLNRMLERTMASEKHLVARPGLPFGVSLIAVARARPRPSSPPPGQARSDG